MSDRAVQRFDRLAVQARERPPNLGTVRLIAVDGPGGAGKSAFARRLAMALDGAPVVHTDDLAAEDVQFDWWSRLEAEVLGPLSSGEPARFRPTDWVRGGLQASPITVPVAPVVLLEGVSASRARLAARLSAAVWVDAPAEVRLERGLERDGEDARPQWKRWMREETAFFATDRPWARADLLVDGAPDHRWYPHDPDQAFVARRGPGHRLA
jgi:uridine kinase